MHWVLQPAHSSPNWATLLGLRARQDIRSWDGDMWMEAVRQGCVIDFICWIHDRQPLGSENCENHSPGRPALRWCCDSVNLEGTALQISAGTVIPAGTGLPLRAKEVSAGGESPLSHKRTHQVKPTSWSNDKPHTEFKDTSSFLYNPSSEVKFSAKAHGLILPKGRKWEGREWWPAAGPTLISSTCLGSHSESQIWV